MFEPHSTSRAGRFTTAQLLSMLDSDNENERLNEVAYPYLIKLLSHPESESMQSDHSNVNAQNFANFRPGSSATGIFRSRCLGFKRQTTPSYL